MVSNVENVIGELSSNSEVFCTLYEFPRKRHESTSFLNYHQGSLGALVIRVEKDNSESKPEIKQQKIIQLFLPKIST